MDNPSPAVRQYCEQRGFASFVREGGFDYLIRRWTRIVTHIEEGYHLTFDDYLNDMDSRKIINELLPLASDGESAKVGALVPLLDNRFLAATRPVDLCVWGHANAAKNDWRPDRDWWYFRIPTNLTLVEYRDE
jgi:hypothetical protein